MMTIKKSPLLASLLVLAFTQAPSITLAQSTGPNTGDKTAQASTLQQIANRAEAAFTAEDFITAAELFAQAFGLDQDNVVFSYNAACAWARAGKNDLAFAWLDKTLKAGDTNAQQIEQDSDLASLHADPRWAKHLQRVQAQARHEARLWNSGVWKTPYVEQLSEDQRIAGLSKFWSEVKYNFIFTETLKELDWDAQYLKYLPKVRAATSTLAYYRVLMEMCALLKDGHTSIYPPQALYASALTVAPFKTRLIEGKVIITEVKDETLRQQGVLPGVEIVRVDQQTVQDWAAKNSAPYTSASTPQDMAKRIFSNQFLLGSKTEKPKLELNNAAGKSWQVVVERVSREQRNKDLASLPAFEWRLLPGNIAYVALNSFDDDTAANDYIKHFAKISQAKAIIFDIRENGGGNSGVGYKILATLTNKNFSTSRAETRDYKPTLRAWGYKEKRFVFDANQAEPDPGMQFTGQVMVLTSAQTYSAAEDFAVAFDIMKRGTLIGEATGGSTGQPLHFDLPGGGSARVCTKQDSYPDGKPFVGVGIQPNIVVRPKVADFRAGRDTVLEVALAQLSK